MRDDNHRHVLLGQCAHGVQHFAGEFRIQRRGWLIEQHDVGLHRQGPRDGHALLLAARQARGITVALVEQSDLAQQGLGLGDDVIQARRLHRQRRLDEVLQDGQMRKQVEVLKDHAHLATDAADIGFRHVFAVALGIGCHQHLAFDLDAAAVDGFQMDQTAQEGALARS